MPEDSWMVAEQSGRVNLDRSGAAAGVPLIWRHVAGAIPSWSGRSWPSSTTATPSSPGTRPITRPMPRKVPGSGSRYAAPTNYARGRERAQHPATTPAMATQPAPARRAGSAEKPRRIEIPMRTPVGKATTSASHMARRLRAWAFSISWSPRKPPLEPACAPGRRVSPCCTRRTLVQSISRATSLAARFSPSPCPVSEVNAFLLPIAISLPSPGRPCPCRRGTPPPSPSSRRACCTSRRPRRCRGA